MDTRRHFPWLDWLRFLAALVVLVGHVRLTLLSSFGSLPPHQQTKTVAAVYAATRLGHEAVLVFFVLSGYLVAGKAVQRMLAGRFRVGEYSVDRATRVYLPYVPALILSWICWTAVGGRSTIESFFWNLLCLQGVFDAPFAGNSPLWSIAFETWFYVLLGSVGALMQFRRVPVRAAISIGVFLSAAAVFTVLSSTYLLCWLIGGAAYFIRRPSRWLAAAAFAVFVWSVVGTQVHSASVSVDATRWTRWFPSVEILQLSQAAGIAMLISHIVHLQPATPRLELLDALGSKLAAFSYTLYLVHYPVLRVLQAYLFPKRAELSLESIGACFSAFSLSILVAVAMYWLFERNTVAVRRRVLQSFAIDRAASPEAPAPAALSRQS